MSERPRLEVDGVAVQKACDFQTFARRVFVCGKDTLVVSIPIVIARKLKLSHGSLVQIAIRPITGEEALREFGYVPRLEAVQVLCPVCGEKGSLHILYRGTSLEQLSVTHRKKHGFDKVTWHSIRESEFPEFHAKYRTKNRR